MRGAGRTLTSLSLFTPEVVWFSYEFDTLEFVVSHPKRKRRVLDGARNLFGYFTVALAHHIGAD